MSIVSVMMLCPPMSTSAADYLNENFGTFPLCEQLSDELSDLPICAT
jgi:hypothetical protein